MMHNAHDKVRKTIEIDTDLEAIIQGMADKKIWSFSQMAYVLLMQAVKEKTRKNKPAEKSST